jgi:hypothetical protein
MGYAVRLLRYRHIGWYLHTFNVWTEFTVVPVRASGHPRGMALVTRMQELQAEQAW